ncbi:DUF305 domain-containing protein [Tessaracoccus oleiagri]|uniref:Uncharacterized conserved protein, DUF305 family n=1 Tax=Tessaracoccus oleiagri TaxID=686624 RepID=A0A1G9HI78_9ACTN|nr:DUF305 domain-containing protein [Tessaracoccus oleiagri]SDL12434.1 Uncharacterized conserved protein, DUF305 family [Tessaracoccus oleiagri]
MTRKKLLAVTVSGVVAAATLVGCADAGTEPTTAAPATPAATSTASSGGEVSEAHNDADTDFAQMMIVHHEGAIEMADLATDKAESAEVKDLAERIAQAQGPEIEQMTAWLEAWGEDVSPSEHGGMDHGGMEMDGMSQEEMMAHLEGLEGQEFDQAFLEGMIAHHQGAVEMADAELAEGENPEALALAEKIISDQEAEIAEMQEMLAG